MGKDKKYYTPAEWEPHECTWLQWPHEDTPWGKGYQPKLDGIWVQMVKELHKGEKVRIIVCNETEKRHVLDCLKGKDIEFGQVEIYIKETNDVWVRDNGPIFVRDGEGKLAALDWNFNGWGDKYPHDKDCRIAEFIADTIGVARVKAPICLEGGGIEVNGQGSLMAAKTSIINDNRNPGKGQKEIEAELSYHFGVTNFVWISGILGEDNKDEDTDFHIDGAARFTDANTILYEADPFGESEPYILEAMEKHYSELRAARDAFGEPFTLVPVPVTRENSKGLDFKGSYLNYYVGNEVVLVPVYGDENDALGMKVVEGQFPGRRVVGIDVTPLFPYGGMIHCVTQQQPKL